MSRLDDPGFDWTAVATLVVVFAVVVSGAGGGTYAVLSDIENTTGQLTVEQEVQAGQFQTYDVSCDVVEEGNVVDTLPDASEMKSIENFDVPERDGCVKISIWLEPSAFGDLSPTKASIGHWHDGEWQILDTSVSWQQDGWMVELTAYTSSYSPFAVFVPNESAPQPVAEPGNQTEEVQNGTQTPTPTSTPTPAPTPTPTPDPDARAGGGPEHLDSDARAS
jgi:predicted ribosomally synthesized peptide with SipW-like signal peptide